MVVVVQLVRTPDCGSGGRRFESGLPPVLKNGYDDEVVTVFLFAQNMLTFFDGLLRVHSIFPF